jgi:hypothetical protein
MTPDIQELKARVAAVPGGEMVAVYAETVRALLSRSPLMSPADAAWQMAELCRTLSGQELHRAVDALMCDLMRQQGYGSAVEIFLQTVEGYHQ